MAQINYSFYNGKDIYNDGDVEQRLLNHYRDGQSVDDSLDEIFYLTTHIRANILNWYPFNKNDEVLEIGSGCGTLTQMLCQRCKSVCSVEGSKRRAEITYERNKNYDNLEVYAAEFGKFNLEKKFDYVILIGVFEYAKMFFDTESEPFKYFLSEIRKVLKSTGKVLIAIENRYGLKYWAGANEDHLGMPYVGFAQYDNYKVQTFGTNEMVQLIKEMGFENYKFYYPFPDYKLPEIIYTDDRVPSKDEIKNLPIYLYGNQANFDIKDVYVGLIENNQFGFFSNSYIIEFGDGLSELSDVIYAKELSYREKEYRTVTVQTKNAGFKKIALEKETEQHLVNMQKIYELMREKDIPVATQCMEFGRELKIEFCEGESVANNIFKRMKQEGFAGCEKALKELWEFYCSISNKRKFTIPMDESFRVIYPEETMILKLSLLDGNASNIIVNKDSNYVFIDQEWMDERELPAEYLMYYSILHIVNVCKIDEERRKELFDLFDITEEKQRVFLDVCAKYYKNIVNDKTQKKQEGLLGTLECDSINTMPVCYYDTGHGFNEEQKLYGSYQKEGEYYKVNFELPEMARIIRVDPALCGERCLMFSDILIDGENVEYMTQNIIEVQNKKIMVKKNPYIVFERNVDRFEFAIDFQMMTPYEMEEYLKMINN